MLPYVRRSTKRRRKKTIVEPKSNKGQTGKTEQSIHDAYRKTWSVSAEDWTKVNTIDAQYAPALKELEVKRDKLLEETNTKRISLSLETVAKRFESDMVQKAI